MTVTRIWNLRQGDADDNRASPQARGMLQVILAAAFNFNYLRGLINFLAVIIVPALLVGIVPSLLMSYAKIKVETAGMLGTSPFVAVFLLAVLLGVALWLGRPLLRSAVSHFWHLHYSLIFPIFVALREFLRVIVERTFFKSKTSERLHLRRRIGAALAALLLAAGGLGLAAGVEFSMGLRFVDIKHVRLWVLARAALGNAAVILGLTTAAESLYWLWRELRLSKPVLDWTPNPPALGSTRIRVAHLSDLHLVGERYGYRMEPGTHGPQGNARVNGALHQLDAIHARAALDRVLVTGDVTDAGTRAEWAEFLDLLRSHPELRSRLSFVPGNHDLNVVDPANPGRLDLPWSVGQALRKLRVVLALDSLQGDRAHVVNRDSGLLGPVLQDYLRAGNRAESLRALAQRGSMRGRWEVARIWDGLFPLVEPASADHPCGLILLNSNARSHFTLTNAIGVVEPSQLSALKSVLRNYPGRAWLILLHHQIVEYPITSISLRNRIGLALINAAEVLSAIAPHASQVLILHGHRHWDWIGTCAEVVLCSAPSVTLGDYRDKSHHGVFHVHELALAPEKAMQLVATERVEVSQGA